MICIGAFQCEILSYYQLPDQYSVIKKTENFKKGYKTTLLDLKKIFLPFLKSMGGKQKRCSLQNQAKK